ncbi:putative ABC transporter peptide-binding protein YtcQ [Paenibacillus marchantiophytorum]|uniref:ABC transporter peptide-binding protein YtcQ n=1 Tax=Paenibacillus marchantiophytorum TaxID=1619310 RepID=A0ABQ1EV36_9BACL|nr:extracellular solute-binding protein [Paenibacillus marchantiophytorum]GFZ88747.1 putative ABC transporter peptide-binding protein YtcQ [Paenibacillus marchantiophytorum]
MKKLLALGLTVSLASSLAACTSGTKEQPESSAATTSSTPSANTTTTKKITVTSIEGTWSPQIPGATGDGLKKINEKFNVAYKPQYVPFDEYGSKLPVVMAAGDLADVIGMESADANFFKWAKQGAFLPLNEYIDKYPSLKLVPKSVWDAVTVDGKIYAIPQYFPAKYGKKPIIRKDWLDNLGLKMPTNYDELKKVAIAFTKDDPDKNGKNDTYGFGLSKQIVYGAQMGAAWDSGWYNKNEQGQLIPGIISEGFKQQTQFLADLYKEGAIHKDWAISKNVDIRKDFYAGKYGIWYEQPIGTPEDLLKSMKELMPTAELSVIPAFKQADGGQGFMALSGYYTLTMLNAKIKSDPDKINRILQMQDYFRTFIPVDNRNPQNAEFDWANGGVGVGYKMVDGLPLIDISTVEQRPTGYFSGVSGWAPNDEANEAGKVLTNPFAKSFVNSSVELLKNTKFYINPIDRIYSEVFAAKGAELSLITQEWQTKMIVGQEPISNWSKMVDEYMKKGGKEMIDDVNKVLLTSGIKGEWK